MKATRLPGDRELAGLDDGIEALLLAADRKHGARLTRSLQKLREHESPFPGGESNASQSH
ncbi:hypothetical protein D3C86_2228250 [compost metagenome]